MRLCEYYFVLWAKLWQWKEICYQIKSHGDYVTMYDYNLMQSNILKYASNTASNMTSHSPV